MVMELSRNSLVPSSLPLSYSPVEFDHEPARDDVDPSVDGYAPLRSFATVGQDRLVVELIDTLRESLDRLRPRHRRPFGLIADRNRRFVA